MKFFVNQLIFYGQIHLNRPLVIRYIFLVAFICFLTTSHESWSQTPSIPGTGTSADICGTCAPTGWDDIGGTPDISNRTNAGGGATLGGGATWNIGQLPLPPTGDIRWITMRDVGDFNTQADESVTSTITGLLQNRIYKLSVYVMTSFSNNDGVSGGGAGSWYGGTYMDDFGYQVGTNPRVDVNINNATYQDQWALIDIIFVADNGTVQSPGSMDITIFPNDDAVTNGSSQNFEIIHFAVDDVNAIVILDTDGDGINDFTDIDDDNDGILDVTESGGNDPNGDEDGDGIPNYLDTTDDGTGDGSTTDYTDSDGNGLPDVYDFDGDGIANHLDLDSDNDGILDNREFQTSSGYTAPSGTVGINGYYDIYETSADSGVAVNAPENTDGTGGDDYLDIDSDDDGIPDNVEAQSTLGYVTPTGNVGDNGVDSAYENVDTYSAVGVTPTNTDVTDEPDYRDTDSDNDGTTDINENGEGNVLSGSDNDGDGLDNNFDADNSNYDVNDNINTPSTDLPDVDADVNSGGDVDFRDNVTGLDSDGDLIPDSVDIDDDNDGILDTEECASTNFPASGANAITVDIGVGQQNEILDGIQGGGDGARFNSTSDQLVLQLRANDDPVPAGTDITITTTASNTQPKTLSFEQSDASGNNNSNQYIVRYNSSFTPFDQEFTGSGNGNVFTITYTLATDATHINITMLERPSGGGRINIDYLEYAAFSICSDTDTDGDGIVDRLDIDSDNDGITDNYEAQSTSGYTAPLGVDADEDGLDDAYDEDLGGAANSDGINSSEWVNTDGGLTNSDTIPDYLDIDSDNDGIPDNIEAQSSTSYMTPNGVPGANGLDSAYDFNDSFSNTGLSTTLINTDGDAEPDYRDTDSDGDGTDDDAEGLTGTPSFSGVDTDGDGLDDAFENGSTNDGYVVNDGNSDPAASGFIDVDADVNTGGDLDYRDTLVGQDTDGDGIVDSVDIDDDNDGILDTVEGEVADFDGDGIPNSLDQDSDGDGILDIVESQTTSGYTAPTGNDTDNDGLDDAYDATPSGGASGSNGTTPEITVNDGNPDYLDIDTDDDGIPDNVEAQTTGGYTAPSGTVGLNGVDANYENNDTFTATGLSPNNNDGTDEPDYRDTDSDNDATSDADESGITLNAGVLGTDSDGDGLDDIYEGSNATAGETYDVNDEINDPVNNLLDADGDGATTGDVDFRDDVIFIDSDGDGVEDSVDLDDDNDGILDTVEDAAGDADFDGIPNRLDIDSDDDGIPDNIEAQSTTGYIAPSGTGMGITDANGNGVDDNYETLQGGTDITPVDTDTLIGNSGDGTPDYLDTDSDNDGILDINENGNANSLSGTDTDGDGLDDAFEGVLNDNDVNDDIDNPLTDLPDIDTDASIAYVDNGNGANDFNDVDYRDIDDDRAAPSVSGNILWLRADIGVTGVATVTNWADQSVSALNATNTGNAPAKLGDGTATDGLNFNPTIDFTESSSQDLEITGGGVLGNATNYDNLWVYAVTASNSATNASHAFSNAVTGGNVEFEVPTTGSLFSYDTSVGTTPTAAWGGTAGAFNLWNAGSSTGTSTPSGTNKAIYRDGLLIGSNSAATGQFTSNNSSSFIGSDANGANFFDGQITEIMVFNTAPTSAEQQIIQSYLAIKYGITLDQTDNDGTIDEGDYVLQGGSIVWNESNNSAYHNDVAGIGRDDDKFLNQKQSRSINATSEVTIGLGQIEANNGSNSNSFSSDGDFLMWGHNGAVVNNANTSSVTLLCESELQLDRVWKIVETGSVGSVEIAISQSVLNGALLSTSTEVRVFKVADDPNFTSNVKHIPLTTTRDINGTTSYVVDFDFNGTKYFTYSEVLGIFWNGDTNAWTGGSGTAGAPAIDAINGALDGQKVLVIDSETSGTNAIMTQSANVECLWVKANSKLVVSSDLFIEFDQDFILDGEIRLIDDAQLVQSHAGLSNVQGNGVLYRDQEATVPNVYRYHYWSSPVTAALGNTTYSTSTVMYDGTIPTSENSTAQAITWKARDASVTSLNGETTNPITIATWWIYSYFNGTSRDDWVQILETGTVNIAEGFIMKSTGRSPQNFTFMGSPNDGTYTKILSPGATSLLGNPYPSVINTSSFLSDNDGIIDGTLYFWEHQGETTTTNVQVEGHGEFGYVGGYSQRNQAMGVAANSVVGGTAGLGEGTYNAPPQFIAVGQGFFTTATAGGTLTFDNSQRDASTNNIFFRNNDPLDDLPKLRIGMDYIDNGARWNEDTGDLEYQENFQNSPVHRQLGINFKEGNTFDYESGFDSQIFDLQPTDMFWDFQNIDSNLIIAGVGEISADLQIPIGFNLETDDPITVMIDTMENMDGYDVYIGDLVTGLLYNLENPVQFDLPKGSYTDRFVLLFGGQALSNDDVPVLDDFVVFMNNTTDQLVIRNNNNSFIEKVELFNILGQPIKVWNNLDNANTQQQLEVLAPTAIYIVKVTTDKGEITKKIIVD